jgi:hypothetical protein
MILLVELTRGRFGSRYVLLDSTTDKYTNETGNIKDLLTYYVGRYRKDALYSEVDLLPVWKEARYDITGIDLTDATEALSAIYEKYPEILL